MVTPNWIANSSSLVLGQIATAILDEQGYVSSWSRPAADLLRLSAAQVRGKPLDEIFVDAALWQSRTVDRWSKASSPVTADLRRDGSGTVSVVFQVVATDDGSAYQFLFVPATSVTDWDQGTALLQAFLAQDLIKIKIYDTNLRCIRSNVAHDSYESRIFGVPGDVESGSKAEPGEAKLRHVLHSGIPLVGHKQQLRTSQTPDRKKSFSISAVRLEDAQGQPAGVAALCTDRTAEERARELHYQGSARIGRSLDVRDTAQDVVEVLVPALGDLAWVNLAEAVFEGDEPPKLVGGGELHMRRAAVGSATGRWPRQLLQPGATVPRIPRTDNLAIIQHGRAVLADRSTAADMYRDPDLIRKFLPEGGHSAMWAPLFARDLVLGTVTVWRTQQPDAFQQDDANLLTEIASRAALSVDNARRYTREHHAAIALQRRLLPRAVTHALAADTAGLYWPAGGGSEIGGDWFDVIPLPSLRVAFVIGDVVGHGLPATATMGRLRSAIQSLANLEFDPGELLAHMDDMVQQLAGEADSRHRDTMGATCLYAVYDPVARSCTLASAGHPPPLLIRPDGSCQRIELSPGPPLGVGGMPFETVALDLEPGSVIALYTDGMIDRADHDPDAGIQQLAAELTTECRHHLTLDEIGRAVFERSGKVPSRDDSALLLARTRGVPPDDIAEWEFPADPAAVSDAREATSGQLADWGLEDLAFTTELLVSELVTNAIRYAGGPIELRLIRSTSVLVCEVTDPSNTQPRLRRARTTDEGGRGLFLVAQLAARWGSRYRHSGKTIWTEQLLSGAKSG
jgi:serine phosphatase RsbU (regulator of sigma subunit)/anti-sigma regulatory factor (Ser/Thr protein kinase)